VPDHVLALGAFVLSVILWFARAFLAFTLLAIACTLKDHERRVFGYE